MARRLSKEQQTLVVQHLPIVERVVRSILLRRPNVRLPPEDMHSVGVLGLIDALERNGGDCGEGFPSYAYTRILGRIYDELRQQDWFHRRARMTPEELAARSVIPLDDVPPQSYDPIAVLESREVDAQVTAALNRLEPRERLLIRKHYFDGCSFNAIAASLGLSQRHVFQLRARALLHLRQLLAGGSWPPRGTP